MPRIRTIKPEFFHHEGLAELSPLHRLLFIGLWTLADREGRIEYRPKRIKAALLPWEDCDVEQLLADLARAGFLEFYAAAGVEVLVIPAFQKHQRPHPKEAKSDLPPPPEGGMSRVIPRRVPEARPTFPSAPVGREGKEISDKGKEILEAESRRPPSPPAPGSALGDRLNAAFREARDADYQRSFSDEQALRQLLKHAKGDETEVVRRYRIGLAKTTYPRITTWVDLAKHWNACATTEAQPGATPPRAASTGRTREPEAPCACCDSKATGDVWGQPLCPTCHAAWDAAAPSPLPEDPAAWTRSWVAEQRARAA